jgi:hypothetical protein
MIAIQEMGVPDTFPREHDCHQQKISHVHLVICQLTVSDFLG